MHVARGSVVVNGHDLAAGDALESNGGELVIARGDRAEVLVFDLPGD